VGEEVYERKAQEAYPAERLKIVEDLYATGLKVREISKKLMTEKRGETDGKS
jgi:hypothetical protein